MRSVALGVVAAALALLPGCSLYRRPEWVDTTWRQGLRGAQALAASDEWVATREACGILAQLRPGDAELCALSSQVPAEVERLFERPWLGTNVARRAARPASLGSRLLLWLPERLLDLLDVVSFDVALGPGLLVDVHLTRAAQLAVGGRACMGVGWHEQRSLGLQFELERGLSFFGLGGWNGYGFRHGTGPSRTGAGTSGGWHAPGDLLYRDWRDYWAVGAGAHLLYVGASVDLHPLQVADFLAGIVGFDPLGDDLARGTWQPVDGNTFGALQVVLESLWDEPTLRDFRAWDAAREAQQGTQPAPP